MKSFRIVKVSCALVCSFLFASHALGQTWTGNGGDGLWSNGANWSTGTVPANNANVRFDTVGGQIYITSNQQVQQLHAYGPADVTLNIAAGVTFGVNNGGGAGIHARAANIIVDGPGLLALSTGGDTNPLDCGAFPGYTLTYNAEVTGIGSANTAIESYTTSGTYNSGTLVVNCLTNAFTGQNILISTGHIIVVPKLAPAAQVSPFGKSPNLRFNYLATLRYVGTGDTTDRAIHLNGNDGGQIEHAGSGPLFFTGPAYNINSGNQTLVLRGDSAYPATLSGTVYNNSGTLAIRKEGAGTWILSGANTFTGGLTVNGGTLGLDSASAAGGVAQITMASGTALSVNPSAAPSFSASIPTLTSPGSITITVTPAGNTSTVTFSGLNATFVAITAPNAGTIANRIFISGLSAGPVGPWLTLNGSTATYDPLVAGLTSTSLPTQYLATKGSTLTNDVNVRAVINALGTGPSITLPAPVTYLYGLTMGYAGDDATVNTAGKTLLTAAVAISDGASALTLGDSPQDGILLPPITLTPAAPPAAPDSAAVAALNPLIWYDPSDASTITLYGGMVTNLANKAASGPAFDAKVRAGWSGPSYATGSASHAALPMLKIGANGQGLESRANTGISGTAPRTLFAVLSKETSTSLIEVSLGTGENNRRFCVMHYTSPSVRFSIHGADLDMPSQPAETPTVMTILNGVGGVNTTWQGFMNGTPTGSAPNSTAMNTLDTPLFIGYVNNSATSISERGQVGEVLLFNTSLSTQDRGTVEAYLIAKWKTLAKPPAPPAQSATLSLGNDSTTVPLTINAAIASPDRATISLFKSGPGDITLAGGATLTGAATLNDGTLTVSTPAGKTDTFSGAVAGPGRLVKDGPGSLLLPPAAANTYTGGTDIRGGVVTIGNSRSLGTGPVTITDGGTLDIGANLSTDALSVSNRITISGAGHGGMGAIVNNGPVQQMNGFAGTTITLADDATIGGILPTRWDFRASTVLDLAGHTLTKVGAADLRLFGGGGYCCISNAPAAPATAIHIQKGTIGIELAGLVHPNTPDRNLVIDGEGRFGVYNFATPFNWQITLADGADIWSFGTEDNTNRNVITSSLNIPAGTLYLTANGAYSKTLTGQITGPGGLAVTNGGLRAMSLLTHPNNTFAGPVSVINATLGLLYTGSLPGGPATAASKVTLGNTGGLRLYAGPGAWTLSDVLTVANSGLFLVPAGNTKQLQIDVAPGHALNLPALANFEAALDKFGAGSLALDGGLTLVRGNLRTYAGSLYLTNSAPVALGPNHIYLGEATIPDGTGGNTYTLINGDTVITSTDNGYNNVGPGLHVATHNSRCVLDLCGNARISARAFIGGWDTGDTSAIGAVYQSGNASWFNTCGANNDGRIGNYGYGYWQIDGGAVTNKGYMYLGTGNNSGSSIGILRQTAGIFVFNGKRYTVPTNNGGASESYNGFLGISRGSTGVLHLEGGTFEHYGDLRVLDFNGNSSRYGTAILTVTGTADVMTDRELYIGDRQDATANINLNGGKLTTGYFRRTNRTGTTANINFNGGTLSITNNNNEKRLFYNENTGAPITAYIYGRGATIHTAGRIVRTVDIPLQETSGSGVTAVNVTAGGTAYIAPPHVTISGGGGSGATAIATIDRLTGAVTAVEVTCPGRGYTTSPTVAFSGGGGTGATATTATAPNAPGGLTKTGTGTLVLNAPSTYKGPTRVEEGTLMLGHPAAIHPYSEIIIGNGTLDLGGYTVTNISVTLTGTGRITNGKVFTSSATKTGPGTASWDAEIEFGQVAVRQPGLWEGRLTGSFNTDDPNPATAIALTTRAANGFGNTSANFPGGLWIDNATYVYTGYIWNRNATNETWTFARSFDDSVQLKIDNIVRLANNVWTTIPTVNVLVTPGPHLIEIRFGQGSGGVGAANQQWWTTTDFGFGVDYLGRNVNTLANYVKLEDPGDGSRLTLTPVYDVQPDTAIRIEDGTLLLPSYTVTPGLWEGSLANPKTNPTDANPSNINTVDPNPCTAIELTTTAANGGSTVATYNINGKPWANYTTYVYTGYIWNRNKTNETWTFAKSFDDALTLSLDDVVWSHGTWNQVGKYQYTARPGPQRIEIRFGQGGGGFAAQNQSWWTTADYGFGVDYLGRNQDLLANYPKLEDPGTGIRLTLTADNPNPALLTAVIPMAAANGATLDLGNQPRSGLILSPAGDDAIGLMGITGTGNNALSNATYRVTLGAGAASDTLAFAERPDLTGLTIAPSDVASASPAGNNYVIATSPSGFGGAYPTLEGFESKWRLLRRGNDLLLTTLGGTVLILR